MSSSGLIGGADPRSLVVAVIAVGASILCAGAVAMAVREKKRGSSSSSSSSSSSCLRKFGVGGEVLRVGESSDADVAPVSLASLGGGRGYDLVLVEDAATLLDDEATASLVKAVKAGGKIVVLGGTSRVVCSRLTLAGLTNCREEDGATVGVKPTWEAGAKAQLPKKPRVDNAPEISSAEMGASWKVALGDLAEQDLVDEDDLLAQSEAPPVKTGGGCETKRRACKDCTCGRAEMEAAKDAGGIIDEDALNFNRGCGNCSKGDAFRCATCPFLGKPAFEKGQERVILANLDDSSAF